MATAETETMIRENTGTTADLWADLQLVWEQYQSWQRHDRLLAESQAQLSGVSMETAQELQDLLGKQDELATAGQQLQATLQAQLKALETPGRLNELSQGQQQQLKQIRTRFAREMELRALHQPDRDQERER